MLSDLRRRKFAAVFKYMDLDRNGLLERSDYVQYGKNAAELLEVGLDSAEYEQLHAQMLATWQFMQQITGAEDAITEAGFIQAYAALTADDTAFEQLLLGMTQQALHLGDRNGDGKLDEDEYVGTWGTCGVDEAVARAAFRRLDSDGDGYLTHDQYMTALTEFLRSEDPDAPGNWVVGEF